MQRTILFVMLVSFLGCSEKNSTPALSEQENALLSTYVSGLEAIATKSPAADSLLAFYRSSATVARPLQDGNIQVLEAAKNPQQFFFVVPVVSEHVTSVPGEGVIAAAYSEQVMRLNNNSFTDFVRGILLAHELVHAQDELLHGEPPSDFLSDIWIAGEGHAHFVVYSILNEYTQNRWREQAVESAHERRRWAIDHGYSKAAMSFSPLPSDSLRIVSIVGELSRADFDMLLTQFIVDANMLNIKEVTEGNPQDYQVLAHEFLYTYYARFGANTEPQ